MTDVRSGEPERRLERDSFVLATILLPITTLSVRALGFWRCYSLVAGKAMRSVRRHADADHRISAHVARGVRRAAAWTALLPADCLPRSLVLFGLLRRVGVDASFRLGVRALTGRFEAHAWVEVGGRPVDEDAPADLVYGSFDLDGVHAGETVR